MADVTALIATRDCARPGCPNVADSTDGLCRTCRATPARPEPSRAELRALFQDEQEAPVPAFTGRVCKTDGCQREPISRHGMYAGLCDQHRAEATAARREASRQKLGAAAATQAQTVRPQRPNMTSSANTSAAANGEAPPGSLAKLGARVDNTRRELDHARQQHQAALDALRAAIEEHAA